MGGLRLGSAGGTRRRKRRVITGPPLLPKYQFTSLGWGLSLLHLLLISFFTHSTFCLPSLFSSLSFFSSLILFLSSSFIFHLFLFSFFVPAVIPGVLFLLPFLSFVPSCCRCLFPSLLSVCHSFSTTFFSSLSHFFSFFVSHFFHILLQSLFLPFFASFIPSLLFSFRHFASFFSSTSSPCFL